MTRTPESLLTVRGELPFVDREEELALLKNLFEQTLAGTGQVVFVAGEGGVGKTRLVHELGQYAAGRGAIFAVGPSYEEEGLVPYSPWIEAIRTIVQQGPAEIFGRTLDRTAAEVGRLVPELAERAKDLGIKGWISGSLVSFSAPTDAERIRLFQAVTDFLAYASRKKPVVVFLDDILWADVASMQLLHYFARRIKQQSILVIAAYRDVELSEEHALSRLLLDLNRERVLRQITLSRLTASHVAEIISNHLGGGPIAPEFSKLIHSRTGGNAFFVEELLRSVVEQDQVYKSPEGWTLRDIPQVKIPSTVRALIKQRLSRLSNDIIETLSLGAIVGMSFGYELIKRVSDLPEDQLISQLEKALGAGLLRERHVGKEVSYVFADEQIRDFLSTEFSIIRRRRVHARIARAMDELYRDEVDRHLEDLAYHYIQAGEVAKAIEFSLMAGDHSANLHAHSEAKRHYRNVLELMEGEQRNERLEVLSKIGDASYRMGEFDECCRSYNEAVLLARNAKQNREMARLYSRLGFAYWLLGNDKSRALESAREGLRALQELEDTPEEAEICQEIARLLVNTGEMESGLQWCERALHIAKKIDAKEVLAHALQTLGIGLMPNRNNKEEVLGHFQEALKLSLEHGFEDAAARAYANLGTATYFLLGDSTKANEAYMKGIEYSRKIGTIFYEAWTEAELALYCCISLGDWDRALEIANHGLRIGSEVNEVFVPKCLVPIALVNLFRGNIDRAEELLLRAYPPARKSQNNETMYNCSLALGKLYLEKNQLEKAEQYLLESQEAGSPHGWVTPFQVYFELVNLYCAKGDFGKASQVYGRLTRETEELDEAWGYAFERWANGLLASTREEWNEAAEAFRKSSELWNQLRRPYHRAQTLVEVGRVLSKIGSAEKAGKCFEEAQEILTLLKAKLDLAKLGRTVAA